MTSQTKQSILFIWYYVILKMLLYYLQKKEWYRGLISDILISDIKSLRYQDLRKLLKLLRVLSFCFWVLGNIKWSITVECLTGKRMLYSRRPLCNLCFILLVILVWIFLFCLQEKKKQVIALDHAGCGMVSPLM